MNPPNGGLAGCAGRKRNPEGGATPGIMVSLNAILSFASLSWSWSWSIAVVVVFSLVVVGGSPLLRRRPLAKRVFHDPEKRTNSNQGVIQNITKSPATSKQTEREKKQNPLNRAAESAASRILMDVVVLLHLQCFFSTCKFPTGGSRTGLWAARAGTDHASSPERHPSDRAAGVTAGGARGGGSHSASSPEICRPCRAATRQQYWVGFSCSELHSWRRRCSTTCMLISSRDLK